MPNHNVLKMSTFRTSFRKFSKSLGCRHNITLFLYMTLGRRRWRSGLRHCSKSQKVTGWIPDGVTGVFIDIILPGALWP
jgi:hypothetical protein